MASNPRSEEPEDAGLVDIEAAGRALEAFAQSGALVRREIEQLVRTGEADLDRLVRRLAGVLAELAATQIMGGRRAAESRAINLMMSMPDGARRGGPVSANEVATLVAGLVRRGARFQ